MTATFTTSETALPTVQEWAIDPAHTQVSFSVKHLMITNVKGRFPHVTGSVRLDPATPEPEVDVSIDATSAVHAETRLASKVLPMSWSKMLVSPSSSIPRATCSASTQ